jgi:hypothetical protein
VALEPDAALLNRLCGLVGEKLILVIPFFTKGINNNNNNNALL